MTRFPAQGSEQLRCPAGATVNADEFPASLAGCEDVHLESSPLVCELVAGHDGGHVALAATVYAGDQWWWLRWDGRPGEAINVIQIDPCDVELRHARYADTCFLPKGHPGPHSFHLPPLASAPQQRRPEPG
jgi:hypothetical protein